MASTVVEQVSAASGTSPAGNVTKLTVSTSSAPLAGDLLVAFHTNEYYNLSDMTTPDGSGWTLRASGDDGSLGVHVKGWTKTVVTPGTQTVSVNNLQACLTTVQVYVIRDHGGVETATGGNDTTDSTTHTLSSITASTGDSLLLDCLGCRPEGTYTAGTGTARTERDCSPSHTAKCYDRVLSISGIVGSRSATFSTTQTSAANVSIIIKAATSTVRATEFYAKSTRWIKSIWFYLNTTAAVPTRVRLYKVTSLNSGEAVPGTYFALPTYSTTGWKEVVFTKPVILETNVHYRACVLFTGTLPIATANYWTSGAGANGVTNGEMIAPKKSDAIGASQGSYANATDMLFPALTIGSNYWIDVTLLDTPYV